MYGQVNGFWEPTEAVIREYYKRASIEAKGGYVDPRKYRDLDKLLYLFAKKYDCSYDDAYLLAKTGQRLGALRGRTGEL